MSARAFRKVLVANRGEIAVRVIRACREMGIASVAVFSEADRAALHVRLADEAYPIGPAPSRESYLRIDRVLDAARASGAEAIHPGYGFLAENAAFARACEEAGIVFIGPRSETIALMGEKTSARREAVAAGVPVVPGTLEPLADEGEIAREAERIGYPVMLKAAAGGGGKGLRLVAAPAELAPALARARSEAQGAFGDDRVYLEKAIVRPRHVEIQVLADHHGNAVHLFERECSIQRRHQKVIEESPSPFLTPELRERMGELAVALVKRVGYVERGDARVPGGRGPRALLPRDEHAAPGRAPGDRDGDRRRPREGCRSGSRRASRCRSGRRTSRQRGHAIECRVYAEDPDAGFLPSPGTILALRVPGRPRRARRLGRLRGLRGPHPLRPAPLEAGGLGGEPGRGHRAACAARSRSTGWSGSRRRSPSSSACSRHPAFVAGDFDTSFVDTALAAGKTAGAGERSRSRSRPPPSGPTRSGGRRAGRRRRPRPAPRPGARPGCREAHGRRLGSQG